MKNYAKNLINVASWIVKIFGGVIFFFLIWYSFRYTHHLPLIYSAECYPITDPLFSFAGASYFMEGNYDFLTKGGYCDIFPHQLLYPADHIYKRRALLQGEDIAAME